MNSVTSIQEYMYKRKIDLKKDHWTYQPKTVKKWDRKSYISAYIKLLSKQVN